MAVINAVIPILFIFTPPLAGFLAEKVGNFRVLLSILTALGGICALLLLAIPPARNTAPYPENLHWGVSFFVKIRLYIRFKRSSSNKSVASFAGIMWKAYQSCPLPKVNASRFSKGRMRFEERTHAQFWQRHFYARHLRVLVSDPLAVGRHSAKVPRIQSDL